MRTLLTIFCSFSFLSSFSQACGTVISHQVIPTPLTENTEALLNLQVTCHKNIWLSDYNIYTFGDSLQVDVYYCKGWVTESMLTNDTISLDTLSAGHYNYHITVFLGSSQADDCATYNDTTDASGSFSVISSTADLNQVEQSNPMTFYPNPASNSLFFGARSEELLIQIYALDGTLVLASSTLTGELILPDSISPGTYYIQIDSGNEILKQKLIIL